MKPYPEYKPTTLDWLPRVPKHWEVKKLKYAVDEINVQTNSKTDDEIYLALENVESWTGRIIRAKEEVTFESNVKRIEKDDVLFGRLRPYLAKVAKAPQSGVCVGEFLVLRPKSKNKIDNKWLQIRLLAQDSIELINSSTYGAKMPRASWNFIGNTEFALPPLDEQERIVRYLGAKHREIESYIAAKRSLLVRLKELSAATISRAVTRGLNPNVAVKPSGVEWLGDVPEHWTRLPVKRLVKTKITDGPHETPEIVDEGIPFLSAESVKNGIVDFNLRRGFITRELHEVFCRKCRPQRDDIFMVKSGATTGKTAIVETDEEFSIWSPLALIRANEKLILPRYLFYAIREESFQKQVQLSWSFGTQQNIGMGVIEKLFVTVPPLAEQAAIVAYLENQLDIIGEARSRIEREIELARELYQTLVANVVTGQVDVSDIDVADDSSHGEDELAVVEDDEPEFEDELSEVEDE